MSVKFVSTIQNSSIRLCQLLAAAAMKNSINLIFSACLVFQVVQIVQMAKHVLYAKIMIKLGCHQVPDANACLEDMKSGNLNALNAPHSARLA